MGNIPENDILTSVAIWLWRERKVVTIQSSVARGSGIDKNSNERRLQEALQSAGAPDPSQFLKGLNINSQFAPSGPDIIGLSVSEYWRIECKGSGSGKRPTQRNNFDRALASTVSYYSYKFEPFEMFLGLALPSTSDYMAELRRRVKMPLRRQLNMWVLLYDPQTCTIQPVSPEKEYP